MTSALTCDGCGRIVTERSEDGDNATSAWWLLEKNPSIAVAMIAFEKITLNPDYDDEIDEVEIIHEPPRHFCAFECLKSWAADQ